MTPWPPSSVPFETASSRPKAGTTAPAGSTSILSSPPVMSFTFLAKASANSWKISLVGQVLWNRSEVISAREIIGNPIAAAPPTEAAVAVRNFRRVIERWDFFRFADFDLLVFLFIASSLLQVVCERKTSGIQTLL